MKSTYIAAALLLLTLVGCSQPRESADYKRTYDELCNGTDDSKITSLISEWEEELPQDPEMYITAFNFYLQRSKQGGMRTTTEPGEGENLQITDLKTKKPVGYLSYGETYNEQLFDKSINYLKRGIEKNPKRLDMYFGMIHSIAQRQRIEEQTQEILKMMSYAKKIDHNWLWKDGKSLSDDKEFMKRGIQDYIYDNMFDQAGTNCNNIKLISEKLVEMYPNDVFGYSNMGSCNLMQKNIDDALKYYSQAEKIDKTDVIILANIANAYELKGQPKKAIEYYNKMIEHGTQQYKDYAQSKINELNG